VDKIERPTFKIMIKSQRLTLKPIALEDAGEVFAYRGDAESNKYQGWIPNTLEDVVEFINKNPVTFNVSNSWFQLAIIDNATAQLIGDVGIHFVDDEQCEVGCTINKEYHQKGYAKEALKATIDYLFQDLNKHRITASVDPRNNASVNLMKSLGFRLEAHHIKSLFFKNEWVDDMVFAILKEEWC
jgi:RimJ/RimL family protein N-acetyltransferase